MATTTVVVGPGKEAYEAANPGPAAQGIVAQTAPGVTTAGALVDGTVYFIGISLMAGQVVSRITVAIGTAGVGVSLSKVGLYSVGGTRLAVSADQATAWESTGAKNITLVSPYTVPSDGLYYAAIVAKAATTLPTPVSVASTTLGVFQGGPYNGGSVLQLGTLTGQTDLPTTATITAGTPKYLWFVLA